MAASSPGREARAARSRADWDSVADGWAKWWSVIEAGAEPVSARLVALARLGPGQRVLDLATGLGEPAAHAARLVAPGGTVVATDIAPAMLDRARSRLRALGLDNVTFRVMDGSRPDLPAASFDAILCRWGLMFVPDLAATLAALARLLRPGGRIALAVWAAPDQVPCISLPGRVLAATLELPDPPAEDPTPFDLCDIEALQRSLRRAGFSDVASEPAVVTFTFDSPEAYVRFRREATHTEARLTEFPAERRAAAWRAVGEAAARYRRPDGRVAFDNLAFLVSARR